MVLAFRTTGDIRIDAEGKFSNNQLSIEFPAIITKDSDGRPRAEVAIRGFRFDQKATDAQLFDVYQMQVGIVDVIGDTVKFSVSCENRGKTEARWTGHINVVVIADIVGPG